MLAKCQKQKEKGNMTVHSHYKIENIFVVYIQSKTKEMQLCIFIKRTYCCEW